MLHRTQRLHVYTNTHLHMDSSFIQGGSTSAKPFRSNHFCILEECKICGGHLFSILLVEGDWYVCVRPYVLKPECEREIISICEFALTRLACGPLLWTQCKEMQSSSTGLVSKMSGMLTYAVLDVKYNNSVLLCVCVQALVSLVFQIRQEDAAYNKWKAVKWTKWHQVSFIDFGPCNSNHLLGGKSVREMCLGCEWFSHLFGNGRCLSLPNGKSTLVRY